MPIELQFQKLWAIRFCTVHICMAASHAQWSPVHYRLGFKNNKKVTFAVRANRMNPLVDPGLRPVELR